MKDKKYCISKQELEHNGTYLGDVSAKVSVETLAESIRRLHVASQKQLGEIKTEASDIRQFNTGANRDTSDGKLDYEACLSPIVLEAYANYIKDNRKVVDGSIRADDNWQKLFGEEHLDVCMKSAFRHFMDLWKEHRGYKSRDGIDSAINGVLFNVMAYYYKILKDRGV